MSGRIIIVSNRLPLSIVQREGRLVADRSIGGLATALSSIFGRYDPVWVGWTGVKRVLSRAELASLDLPEGLVPVEAPPRMIQRYYDRYCNRVRWPALHGIKPGIKPKETDINAYEQMNKRFASVVANLASPEDLIWVHDFHLLLLPAYLRAAGIKNRIGFFLHTPFLGRFGFVHHEDQLIEGLAAIDLIGLQTERDVNNMRALGLGESVKAIPIGIDHGLYKESYGRPEVAGILSRLKGDRHMILSISRLDQTKGIIMQLKAVAAFLRGRNDRKNFVYRTIVAPSRENVPEYMLLKRKIAQTVSNINKRLGTPDWQPVEYEYRSIGLDEVCANYLAADILLLTPVVDGMNLIAKEYVAARRDNNGMLVLGETAGAAFQLKDAVLVDPLKVRSIVSGLNRAIDMPANQRASRWAKMRRAVKNQDIFWWTEQFIRTLRANG